MTPDRRVLGGFKLEAFRFLLVGGANFVLTFIVFFSMFKVWGINHLISLVVAWAVGMGFSYALNFTWVFKPEEQLQFRDRFAKYFAANVVSILLNLLTLHLIVEATGYDPFYVQFALIPLIVIFNFSTAKYWSLRTSSGR